MAEAEQSGGSVENRQEGHVTSTGVGEMADFAAPTVEARRCDDGREAGMGIQRADSVTGSGAQKGEKVEGEGRRGGNERNAEGGGGRSGDGDGSAVRKPTWQERSGLRQRKQSKGPSKRVLKRVDAPDGVLATYDDAFLFGHIPLPMRLRAMLSKGPLARLFQILDVVATLGSVTLYVWQTYHPDTSLEWMVTLQTVFSSFFLVDYIINLFSAYSWFQYMVSWQGILDFISLLPLLLIRL
ncbi:unnamed protein product [Closterium sp. NIES-53]